MYWMGNIIFDANWKHDYVFFIMKQIIDQQFAFHCYIMIYRGNLRWHPNCPSFNSVTTMWLYKDNCTKSNILTWCKIKIVLNFHFKGVWLLKRHAQKLTLSSVTLTIFLRVKFLPFVYSRVIYWTLKNMKQSFNVQFFLAHEREFFQWVVGIHVNYLFQA